MEALTDAADKADADGTPASAKRLREQADELQCRVEHNRGRLVAIDDDIERRRQAVKRTRSEG
jgi:hypothetical protein